MRINLKYMFWVPIIPIVVVFLCWSGGAYPLHVFISPILLLFPRLFVLFDSPDMANMISGSTLTIAIVSAILLYFLYGVLLDIGIRYKKGILTLLALSIFHYVWSIVFMLKFKDANLFTAFCKGLGFLLILEIMLAIFILRCQRREKAQKECPSAGKV